MGTAMFFTCFLIFQVFNIYGVQSASILFFVMPQSASHRRSLYPFAEALADRGHHVTFFTEAAYDDGVRSKHPNVNDEFAMVDHDDPAFYDMWVHRNSTGFRDLQWRRHSDSPFVWNVYWGMMIDICRLTVAQKHQTLRELVQRKWDLIVLDGIFAACGTAMTKWINAPYMILNPTCITGVESSHRSVPTPIAHIPPIAPIQGYNYKIFYHRLHTTYTYITEYFLALNWDRLMDHAVTQKFPHLKNGNFITLFYANPEFSMSDMPSVFDSTRPMLPDIANIGGHCESASINLTDPDWVSFIDDPNSKGTILLSFGHLIQWQTAPEELVENLFTAFGHFAQYRIAFQYDGEPREIPNHVKLSKWLPVPAILNHPKTKVHITHGGLKSIRESLCSSVPMIILPLFAEQLRNARTVEMIQVGMALDKFNMNVENIVNTLGTVLETDEYKNRISKLRSFTLDAIKPPLEFGVFWAERIMKRKKLPASYFKHKGRHLSWIRYFNLDVIGLLAGCLILAVCVFWVFLKKCYKLVSGGK